jgi:hypothetical protein
MQCTLPVRPAHIPLLLLLAAAIACSSNTTTPTTTSPSTTPPSTFTITWSGTAFPATTVGTTSSTTVVVGMWNTGTTAVSIGAVTDSDFSEFPWNTTCAINGQLLPGTNCTLTTQFKPSTSGDRSATLQIDANGKQEELSLTGTGSQAVNPQLSIAPTAGSATTPFTLTLSGATPSGSVSLHTIYTPAPGNDPISFGTTAWTADSSGHLTVTSSHDSAGTFENWFVDASSGLSSNHVFSTVQ